MFPIKAQGTRNIIVGHDPIIGGLNGQICLNYGNITNAVLMYTSAKQQIIVKCKLNNIFSLRGYT